MDRFRRPSKRAQAWLGTGAALAGLALTACGGASPSSTPVTKPGLETPNQAAGDLSPNPLAVPTRPNASPEARIPLANAASTTVWEPDSPPPSPSPTADAGPINPPAVGSPTAAPSPVAQARQYTIRKGDSLAKIAARYKTSVDELVKANSLADPTALRVGQKLVIPSSNPAGR